MDKNFAYKLRRHFLGSRHKDIMTGEYGTRRLQAILLAPAFEHWLKTANVVAYRTREKPIFAFLD